MDGLFVSKDAALPMDDRFCNRDLVSVKERVYRFGFGVNERRYLPIVKRTIYIHNCSSGASLRTPSEAAEGAVLRPEGEVQAQTEEGDVLP